MLDIVKEFNESNSLNYKRSVCEKYKSNKLFLEVFSKTYDKVKWTWGITMKNIPLYESKGTMKLDLAILELEKLHNRTYVGNDAIHFLHNILSNVSYDDSKIIEMIVNRDLRINFGLKEFNKIVSNENKCTKPPYMRCGIYSDKTAKKIKFSPSAIVQLKADGTYRSVTVENGNVTFNSRSGEEYTYPLLESYFKNLKDGVYIGELLVQGLNNRAESNGLINSLTPPHDKIYIQLWDYVKLTEWSRPKDKNNKTPYSKRFEELRINLRDEDTKNIEIIPFKEVQNIKEALEFTSTMMNKGFEGAILKDWDNIFIDHTSPTQLKLKLEISVEMRCTGFSEGAKGTKREGKIGSLIFENDEGTIKGKCSGFTDKELDEFTLNFEKYKGKILEVQFNDLSKSESNDYYALVHPRFICWREDKNESDTLSKAFELRKMATELS